MLPLPLNPETRAVVFLAAVAALPVIRAALWVRRQSGYSVLQSCLVFLTMLLVRLRWRATIPPWPLPLGQGAVLVANHRSSIDPFFFQITAPRPVHWLVAREYVEHPALGWFLRLAEVIPTRRSGVDTAATKAAIRLAAQGAWVGLFPEGRINRTEDLLLPGRQGAILVALKARVPILPCYIVGSPYAGAVWSPFLMTAKVTVRYGPLIDLSPYYGREQEDGLLGELLLQVMSAMAKLAGRPDFQPRLASRRGRPAEADRSG